jgi:EAL domain-containing protein (putative c-di-GMP-specific phosphodiesterase class I)
VPAIVGLGHALGLKVVAKGVENEIQKAMLVACGCDYLQGYLTGAPADGETAARNQAR